MSEWHAIRPQGLAAQIMGVTVIFTILCTTVVSLRIWLRHQEKCVGVEDWLMVAGFTLNLVHNAVVIYGSVTGIGTHDEFLNAQQMAEGAKVVLLWQLFYVSGSVLIKASICTTLMRVALHRRYIWILRGLIAVSIVTTIMAMSVVLARCQPVAANWDSSLGSCVSQDLILVFTYVVSAVNIATDWSVAIIPVFILWNVQMKRSMKMFSGAVLGLGILASVATIIRMPYSSAYRSQSELLFNIGHIILWTVVECDLGIIAGSIPMLRRLLSGVISGFSQPRSSSPQDETTLVTIGRMKGRRHFARDTGLGTSTAPVNISAHVPGGDTESTRSFLGRSREELK